MDVGHSHTDYTDAWFWPDSEGFTAAQHSIGHGVPKIPWKV